MKNLWQIFWKLNKSLFDKPRNQGPHTTFRRLLCLLSKCWSRNFSARKLFLQYPHRHSFMSTWILCCSWSLNISLSGWSLHLLEISYCSCSTNGIKYYKKNHPQSCTSLNFKNISHKDNCPLSLNVTSSITPHAALLLSLEQCTSWARPGSCLRVLHTTTSHISHRKKLCYTNN